MWLRRQLVTHDMYVCLFSVDFVLSGTLSMVTEFHSHEFYPTPFECSLPLLIQSLLHNLTKFIAWLIDEESFSYPIAQTQKTYVDKRRKCMSIGEGMFFTKVSSRVISYKLNRYAAF